MLNVKKQQLQQFDDDAEPGFQLRLTDYLTEQCGAYMNFFEADQRAVITRNLTARCRALGFYWESNIGLLSQLMLDIAPNFHAQPDILPLLKTAKEEDLSFKISTIAPDAWDRAEAARSDVFAWMPPDMDSAGGWEPLNTCLDVILWDQPPEDRPQLQSDTAQAVAFLGLPSTLEAYCAAAGWVAFYGSSRQDEAQHKWLGDVTAKSLPPEARLAALKARVMLDHARWV